MQYWLFLAFMVAMPALHAAQPRVPLTTGLVMVSATQGPDGDRENLVTVQEASARGVKFAWQLDEPAPGGGRRRVLFGREIRAADLAAARGLHTVFATTELGPEPGTTSLLLSRDTYLKLSTKGFAPLTITMLDPDSGSPITMPGAAGLVSRDPVPFPLLVNGERVSLPSLQVRVAMHDHGRLFHSDFLILAEPGNALILRNDRPGGYRTQMVRIDFPRGAAAFDQARQRLETQCRTELPGVYFASNSARLDERSHRVLRELGVILNRHPDWVLEIEGHTDGTGTTEANLTLSAARAAAVRDQLVGAHGVPAARVVARGLGESRPLESNETLEGRARNRRVEVARACAK